MRSPSAKRRSPKKSWTPVTRATSRRRARLQLLAVEAKILEKYSDIPNYQLLLANLNLARSDIYQHAGDLVKALADANERAK